MLPVLTGSFNAGNCKDSDLTTSCQLPAGKGPNGIALKLVGDSIRVKSITIYTPQTEVDGYDQDEHDIKVDVKLSLLFADFLVPKKCRNRGSPIYVKSANLIPEKFLPEGRNMVFLN